MYGRLFRLQNSFNKHLRIGRGFISGHGQRLYSSASEATNDRKGSSASVGASLPSEADVVVVGGGVIGCATLYHLTKLGITNAILLERDKLTSGTTWHTAGLVWNLRPSDVEIQVLESSRRLMEGLEEETGVHPGWINNGGMFVASNKQRLDEYKRLHTIGKAFGIESQVLSPKETKKVYPLLNVDDVYGTLYVPSNGTIDPAGYCMALTKGATNRGAKVFEGTPVTGVDVITDDYGTKRVNALNTERGTIKTKAVVNCAGAWGPYLGAMAGVNVPLVAMKHAYIVTERIEGIQNMPNIRDHDASIYLKLQGDALCVGGYEPNPHFWDEVKKDFSFGLFDLDWDVFSFNFNGSLNRLPVLEKIGVKSTVCGPESFTPDHKPLLGESPEVRGFYLGCGFNSAGMMLSGGCAEELANWVKNGHPEKDMYAYDISRFYNKLTGDQRWLRERSHEAYAKNYSIVFPYDEPLASRKMRKAPLFETLAKKGCHYQERLGWERPGWFSSELCVPKTYDYYGYYGNKLNYDDMYKSRLEEEYTFDFPDHHAKIGIECLSCREMAAIFDMSYFGQFYLTGPDAKKAADWIFTNDMNKPPGTVVYTCMLNDNGGTAGDLTVAVLESGDGSIHAPKFEGVGYYIATGGGTAQYAHKHILDILQDQKLDCQLIDRSNDMSLLSVQGPNSRNILKHLTSGEFSDEAFPFSTSQVMKIASHDCRVFRLTFVGELGYELHISNDSVIPVYEAITNVGKQYGLVDAGYRAIDSLSIEKGYRHWHGDLRSDDTPLESLLGFTCKLNTDTPFKGREALEKQKTDGIKKRLVCFTLDDRVPLVGLETIYRNNKPCGFIRRADYAFALDTVIGYGYISDYDNPEVTINQKYIKEGDYEIEHLGKRYHATYHLKSPFDPKNLRIKGNYEMPLPINIETFDIDQKSLHT